MTSAEADVGQATSPYQGLMPYTEASADRFFGRDQDILLIANVARANALSILYGPSGVGKSSVLQAGVLRHIRDENAHRREQYGVIETVVAYTSEWRDDPGTVVGRVVNDAFTEALDAGPVSGSAHLDADATVQFCSDHEVDLLLILDQFEEMFLYHDESVGVFAEALARLLHPGSRVSVLIAIREDALARLDEFEEAIPGVFDSTLRLEHLDEEAARSAITEPLRVYNDVIEPRANRTIEPDLVDALIDELQAGRVRVGYSGNHDEGPEPADSATDGVIRVEAPFLQLVLTRLWEEETRHGSDLLRLSTLRELGGAQEIVRQHLDRVVHLFGADELEVMVDAFGHLVTPSGSKIAHTASDLAEITDNDPVVMAEVLRRLCRGDQRILREVPGPVDQVDAEPRFEIFHDVLALAVLDWRRRWVTDATAKAQQAQLVAAKEEAELESREARRRLRRARLVVSGLGLLVAACVVLGLLAVNQRNAAAQNSALDEMKTLLNSDPSAALEAGLREWAPGRSAEYEDTFRTVVDAADTEVKLVLGSPVVASFFVPDRMLVTISEDGFVRLWQGRISRGRFEVSPTPVSAFDVTRSRTGKVTSVGLAGDQRYVALSTNDGKAYVAELSSGKVRNLTNSTGTLTVVTPDQGDGEFVAAYDNEGLAELYDVTNLRRVELPAFDSNVWSVVFDPSGRYLAAFTKDSRAGVWDLGSRRLAKFAKVRLESGDTIDQIDGAFTSWDDGRPRLALSVTPRSQTGDVEQQLWDVSRKRAPDPGSFGALAVSDMVASDKGSVLVIHGDFVARLTESSELFWEGYEDETDLVTSVGSAPGDKRRVAMGNRSGDAQLFESGIGALRRYLGHRGLITSIRFSSDGQHVATSSVDGTVRIWEAPARNIIWEAEPIEFWGSRPGVIRARYTPNGKYVFGADEVGTVVRIGRNGSTTKRKLARDSLAQTIDPAPDGSMAVVVPQEPAKTVLFAKFGSSEAPSLRPSADELTAARWNPNDGRAQIVGGTARNTLELWSTSTGRRTTVNLGDRRFAVQALEYSEDGSRIVSISENGGIRLINAADGEVEKSWTAPRSNTVDISSDGRYVVTAGDDQKVRIWDTEHVNRPVHVLAQAGSRGFIETVALSVDEESTRVAATTVEGFAYVWDRRNGDLLAASQIHADSITDVGFDPENANNLISTGYDAVIVSHDCEVCRLSSDQLSHFGRTKLAQVVDVTKR
jgi:WD40 repeat protein